ncbi:sensor histidine kinase [Sporosarcina sp. BP05]|uniref:ATP-binding protein n=1 Tax=Sporosarcina sp. BP05 TaxID=2758726 RepID=UPI00164564AB|nr:sensor histidine kinase [Sporosarcina sp. BP05]
MIETLLLNFLFLLFPILIAVIFIENGLTNFNKYLFILLSSVTLIFCMAFPVRLELGYIVDLRYIPFIIVALFGGYKMAFPLYFTLNAYRFFIGGDGIFQSLTLSTMVLILVPLLSAKFLQQNSRGRIFYAICVTFLTMSYYFFTLSFKFSKLTSEFWDLAFYTLSTYLMAVFILMALIEKINSNLKRREMYVQAERMRDVSHFSASIAHEIRNPLTVTSGFLQLLNESKTITAAERIYIEFSLQELERAKTIVSDFLTFSKPQSENMVFSDFEKDVKYVENIMQPYAKMNQVKILVRFTNTLKTTYDENQMQQCLINLVKNGIESMQDHGGMLYVDVTERKKNILIKIQDSGSGMTREGISQMGKPYYSTKQEGTGLGMFMVYSTIRNIKGEIKVKSTVGKGTTFLLYIPV